MKKVLFVCLGNICRSPLGEGIFNSIVKNKGLDNCFISKSCGTGSWHAGEMADPRMREVAKKHNINLTSRSRQFKTNDFQDFDLIIAMDRQNKNDLENLAKEPGEKNKIKLMRDFENNKQNPDVPDPYYGGENGFENVFQIVYKCTKNLIEDLENNN